MLAFPFSAIAILSLVLAGALLRRPGAGALRLRRLWQALLIAEVASIVAFSLAGLGLQALGGRGNAVYLAARYLFPVLGWLAIAWGIVWGNRSAAALVDGPPNTKYGLLADLATGALAASGLAVLVLRLLVPGVQRPWSLPFEIAEWYFDNVTTSLASDECLAFRVADDNAAFGVSNPGAAAFRRLIRSDHRAVPGVADYLNDRLLAEERCRGDLPCGVSIGLLAFLAETGDHPVLAAYERYPLLQTPQIRECLHSGHQVKIEARQGWTCVGVKHPGLIIME